MSLPTENPVTDAPWYWPERVPKIDVRCDDPAHAGKVVLVDAFERVPRPDDLILRDEIGPVEVQWRLTAITRKGNDGAWAVPEHHYARKAVLRCRLCGLDFQRRWAKLWDPLDTLARLGVTRVRLSQLVNHWHVAEQLVDATLLGVSDDDLRPVARMFQ